MKVKRLNQINTLYLILPILTMFCLSIHADDGNLRMITFNLSGKLKQNRWVELSVTFSHDMIALGQEREGGNLLKIKPKTEGLFLWKGTRTLAFKPKKPWRWSTTYTVTVPKRIQALNGETLKETKTWTFQTPLAYPTLISRKREDSFDGINGYTGDSPPPPSEANILYKRLWVKEPIYLRFQQPVDHVSLRPFLEIKAAGTNTPVDIKTDRFDKNTVVLTPVHPLLRSTVYRIRIKKGFMGTEGNTGTSHHFSFYIATEPPFYCTNPPHSTINVDMPQIYHYFSNPLKKSAAQKIKVFKIDENSGQKSPLALTSIDTTDQSSTIEIRVKETLRPGQTLMVIMDKDLKNLWGEPLTKQRKFIHTVCSSYNSYIHFKMEEDNAYLKVYSLQDVQYQIFQLNHGIMKHLNRDFKRGILIVKNGKPSFIENIVTKHLVFKNRGPHTITLNPAAEDIPYGFWGVQVNRATPINYCQDPYIYRFWENEYRFIQGFPIGQQYPGFVVLHRRNIDIAARVSRNDSTLWVYRRDNGQSVAGAVITSTLKGHRTELGKTNDQGILHLKGLKNLQHGARLEAVNPANQNDMAFKDIKLPHIDASQSAKPSISTRIFTDREYYKPGEMIYIGGVVKAWKDGKIVIPHAVTDPGKQKPIALVITDPDSNEILKEDLVPDHFGGFYYAYMTGEKAKKGRYTFKIYKNGSWTGETVATIDYFQPDTIETTVSGTKSLYTADDVFAPIVNGRYLSGTPMAGESMEYLLYTDNAGNNNISSTLKLQKNNLEPFTFSLHYAFQRHEEPVKKKAMFDSLGAANVFVPTSSFGKINYITPLHFQATAITREGKEASISTEALYFPGKRVTGIKLEYYNKIEKPVPVNLVQLDQNGMPVSGKTNLILYKQSFSDDSSKPLWEKVEEIKDVHINKRRIFPIKIKDSGFYLLKCDTPDEKNRVVSTSVSFYCYDWNWSPSGSLAIHTAKNVYMDGETIKLFINAPRKGRALITLEAGNILDTFVISLKPTTIYDIPVKPAYSPGIRINVAAWLDNNTTANEWKKVQIKSHQNKLNVTLTASKELSPNSPGRVKVRVTGNDGKPVKTGLIIYAVNEGHLSISGYQTPDLFSHFYNFSVLSRWACTSYNTFFSNKDKKWRFVDPMFDIELGRKGIYGRVTRKDGSPISGVNVTVTNKRKQHVYSTLSSAQGYYYIPAPLESKSILTFRADGFQSLHHEKGLVLEYYDIKSANNHLKEINMTMLTNKEAREIRISRHLLLGDAFSYGNGRGIDEGITGGVLGGVEAISTTPHINPIQTEIASMIQNKIMIRQDFNPLLFFEKLHTDENGEAAIDFKTNELLSTYRIMAVVYNQNSFGSNSCRVLVSKHLLMEEAMPEFAREGDSFYAGVIVSNRKEKKIKVKVNAEAEGLKISGVAFTHWDIPAAANRPVYFSFGASQQGDAQVRFYAHSNRGKTVDTDGLLKKIPILQSKTVETLLDFDAGETILKQVMVSPHADRQILRLKLAPSIIKPAGLVFMKLIDYPYHCLEQRASRIMPFLVMDEAFIDKLELQTTPSDIRQTITSFIRELPQYMSETGGLSYYKDRHYVSDYLTAYVFWLLKLAQQKKFQVQPEILEKMENYLRSHNLKFADESQCFLQYVLSLNNSADPAELKRLYEEREELSLPGICFLLRAIANQPLNNQPDDLTPSAELLEILNRRLRVEADFTYFEAIQRDGWGQQYMPFYSNRYITAMILQAFLEVKGNHPLASRIMNWLLTDNSQGWITTQTNVWILYAMNQYLKTVEKKPAKSASLKFLDTTRQINFAADNDTLTIEKALGRSTAAQTQPIHIRAQADGIVYLTTRTDIEMVNPPAKSRGITITQHVYNSSGTIAARFVKGEIYQVELLLDSEKDVPFTVIDAPVPAGFEVMRKDFATTRSLNEFNHRFANSYSELWTWPQHEVDRTIFYTYSMSPKSRLVYFIKALYQGEFTWPSTVASGMYHPQYYGRTRSQIISVE